MVGKRRFLAYLAASLMMTMVEWQTNGLGAGMSMFYQVGMMGLAGVHFGGVALDKHKNGSN